MIHALLIRFSMNTPKPLHALGLAALTALAAPDTALAQSNYVDNPDDSIAAVDVRGIVRDVFDLVDGTRVETIGDVVNDRLVDTVVHDLFEGDYYNAPRFSTGDNTYSIRESVYESVFCADENLSKQNCRYILRPETAERDDIFTRGVVALGETAGDTLWALGEDLAQNSSVLRAVYEAEKPALVSSILKYSAASEGSLDGFKVWLGGVSLGFAGVAPAAPRPEYAPFIEAGDALDAAWPKVSRIAENAHERVFKAYERAENLLPEDANPWDIDINDCTSMEQIHAVLALRAAGQERDAIIDRAEAEIEDPALKAVDQTRTALIDQLPTGADFRAYLFLNRRVDGLEGDDRAKAVKAWQYIANDLLATLNNYPQPEFQQ